MPAPEAIQIHIEWYSFYRDAYLRGQEKIQRDPAPASPSPCASRERVTERYAPNRTPSFLHVFINSEERDAKHGVTSVREQPSSPEWSISGVTR